MDYFLKRNFVILISIIIIFNVNIKSQINSVSRDTVIEKMIKNISSKNIKHTIEKLAEFKTRHSLSSAESNTEGIGAAEKWVKNEFEKYASDSDGRLTVAYDNYTVKPDGRRIPYSVQMKNIIATLKGVDTSDKRVLLISGHLDSRNSNIMDSTGLAPGADDDASGVAVVLELARIMSKVKFPATIIFAAVTGEEQGLYGSKHLAGKAKKNNLNVIAMLNNDMVGSDNSSETKLKDNINVRVFSEGIPAFETKHQARIREYTGAENDSKSRELARYVKDVGERYVDQVNVKLIYRSDRYLRGGDQMSFSREGFTAVRLCEMHENYYHQHQNVRTEDGIQYGDLPQFVDYDYVKKIAGINLSVLANLDFAPSVPRNVGIDISELGNVTKLKWDVPLNGKVSGYYVLMRETDQSLWQKKIFVKGTEVILPYSKDNYLFAVQSVDEGGHESLPVFPKPVR